MQDGSTTPPPQGDPDAAPAPAGIGGWLLLPAAFVLLSPVYIAWRLLRNARTAMAMMAENTAWTTGLLVVLEFAITAAMLATSLCLIYLLLRRKRFFREAYVTFMLGGVLMAFVGLSTTLAVLGGEVDSALSWPDLWDLKGLLASLAWAAVFIPYMRKSRRVRNTFVH